MRATTASTASSPNPRQMLTASRPLAGDFLHQAAFVGDSAARMLALQDVEPLSPSYGSFHLAYWRDKTSEFADARFQEAGAAMALLADPAFDTLRAERGWPSSEVLTSAFDASVVNLSRLQYSDGCYDEWYKGERGFAATAFTTFSFSMAARQLGAAVPRRTADLLAQVLARASRWLANREDLVKTNHEVVAAAALAAAWRLLGDDALRAAAEAKMEKSLAVQTAEGWFPELGGMDLGYSALILDYLHHYAELMGTAETAPAAQRLFAFLSAHMGPGVTFLGEAGICANAYPGHAGYLATPHHVIPAASVIDTLARMSEDASVARMRTYLHDDLRLCRWANLPLLAALAWQRPCEPSEGGRLPLSDGWTLHRMAGLATFRRSGVSLHLPYVGGAMLQVAKDDRALHRENDMMLNDLTTRGQDPSRPVVVAGETLEIRYGFRTAKFLYPGILPRLVLRLGSLTPASSRLLRALIDLWRVKSGTAVNQSATAVGQVADTAWIIRRVVPGEAAIDIVDELFGPAGARVAMIVNGSERALEIDSGGRLIIRRRVDVASGKVRLS